MTEQPKKSMGLEVVGYGLALFYTISLIYHLQGYQSAEFEMNARMVSMFFIVLLINSIAITRLNVWGRILVVCVNIVFGFYFLQPYLYFILFIPVGYILLLVILFLFLSQPRFVGYVKRVQQKTWNSILIVDDDESLIKTVRPILMAHGYSVLAASTGEAGIQIAKTQKPDLILLDVILPGVKGRDVCRQLKEDKDTEDIPVIFLTAKESTDDIKAEMAVGGDRHLTKPVDPKLIANTVQEVLESRRQKNKS